MTVAEYEWKLEPTKDTPDLALMGELMGVFCDEEINCIIMAPHYISYIFKCILTQQTTLFKMPATVKHPPYFVNIEENPYSVPVGKL